MSSKETPLPREIAVYADGTWDTDPDNQPRYVAVEAVAPLIEAMEEWADTPRGNAYQQFCIEKKVIDALAAYREGTEEGGT